MDNGMESMLDMYLFETNTLIEQLDEILLSAEKAKAFTAEDVNEIFRIMHTLKGSSAMMQFTPIMTVSHRIEDLFYYIRQQGGEARYGPELFSLMFRGCDFVKEQVDKIQNDEPLTDNVGTIVEDINSFLKTISGNEKAEEKPSTNSNGKPGHTGEFSLKVFFDEGCGMENLRSFMIVNSLKEVCKEFTYFPEDIETNAATASKIVEVGFLINLHNQKDLESALNIIKGFPNIQTYEMLVEEREKSVSASAAVSALPEPGEVSSPVVHAAAQNQSAPAATHAAKQSLISVNLTKLDKLMDVVSEIVITESMVTSSPDIQGLKLDNFTKSARQLRKLTDELQDLVMSTRMVPVAGAFQKMHRIVRDVGQTLKKDVKLTIVGEEIEVDKTIVDNIADPIMHTVRNSMDHGIEATAEERTALGKSTQGEILLQAQHTGSEVIITIRDDGKGVDTTKVLAKARDNNLLTKPESDYTQKEVLQLLLLPGFSTKAEEEVTELSGRGVGMDVVKKNIEKVGGTVIITSEMGVGTCTVFKIPLTLAIVDGMEIAVGKSTFTIPITNIRQSFKLTKEEVVYDADQREMVRKNDSFYPILRLHEYYEIDDAITEIENGIIIWVESGDRSYCLFVDELIGEQQVVVKPLPLYLNSFNVKNYGIAGCTILGDGSISIILDILNLYDSFWGN